MALALLSSAVALASPSPTGLLCNFQNGVSEPALPPDTMQAAYRIRVESGDGSNATVWDSGKVSAAQSARPSPAVAPRCPAPAVFITARDPMGKGAAGWGGASYIGGGVVRTRAGTTIVPTDARWMYKDGDSYYNPTKAGGGAGLRESGTEHIDARAES
eukprot:gene33035-5053_t